MKVVDNAEARLMAHSQKAYEASVAETVDVARKTAPRESGRYAESIGLVGGVTEGVRLATKIGSTLAYGGAVEHGADVGYQRGPHMDGAHTTQTARNGFPQRMTDQLRNTPI